MSREKKHHIPAVDKPFSLQELFKTGDGHWGEGTSFGYVTAHFEGGEIVVVEVDGQRFARCDKGA